MPLRAEIVSPEKRHVNRQVDMVVVPGTEGDIAAMPGRAPVMLQLRGGVVSLHKDGQLLERCFVSGGFVDMAADHCIILADSVRALEDLSADDARQMLSELEKELAELGPDDAAAHEKISQKILSIRAEIEVAEHAQ